jgi:hypothetical protein
MAEEELVLRLRADVTDARQRIADLNTQLDELAEFDLPELTVDVEADLTTAEADLNTAIEGLQDAGVSIDVPVEIDDADVTNVRGLETALRNIPVVGPALGDISQSISSIGESSKSAGGFMAGLLGGLGAVGLVTAAVNVAGKAWSFFRDRAEEARRKAQELADTHRDLNAALTEGDVAGAAAQFSDLYGPVISQAEEAGVAIDEVTRFITGQADSVPSLVAGFDELTDAEAAALENYSLLGSAMGGFDAEQIAALQAQQDHNNALRDTSESLADARHQYAEQGDVLTVNETNLGLVAQGLVTAAEAEGELGDSAALTTEELAAQREELEEARVGAQAYATAISSVDFGEAELQGAATAMSEYSAGLFAAGNAVQASEEAFAALGTAIGENAVSFNTATEAGRAQQDALEGVASVVDNELANAYDAADGSMTAFMENANAVRNDVIAKLMNDLDLTAQEATAVATALGLTEGDFKARFDLAGAAEAQLQLGLLQGAIEGLPDDIELQVNTLIAQGKYVEARDTVQAYYESNPALLPTEADVAAFTEGVAAAVEAVPSAIIETGADTEPAEEGITEVTEADHPTTIAADGDTAEAAAAFLAETSKDRFALIRAEPQVGAATIALDNLQRPRTATVVAHAHTGGAESELNRVARTRTSTIIVRTVGGGGGGGGQPFAAAAPDSGLGPLGASGPVAATFPSSNGSSSFTVQEPVVHHHHYNATVNAAVIGNRFDTERAVVQSFRQAARLSGNRQLSRGKS